MGFAMIFVVGRIGVRRDAGGHLQQAGDLPQSLQERLCSDRGAAQATLRSDSESCRNREGLHGARTGDARGCDQRAQSGLQRPPGGGADPGNAQAIQGLAGAEGLLSGAMGRLFAVAEQYPDLKANQNMMQLTEELTSTENKVAFARQDDGVTV